MSESFYSTAINDDEMARRFAKFQLHKIEGLAEDLDPTYWDTQLECLSLALSDSDKNESKHITQALKNYVVIHLVTIIEDTVKRNFKYIIDQGDFEIKKLFYQDELHIKLESLDALKTKEITKGTIIASNFNFQNLNEIDYVFSSLFKFNFFDTLLEFCKLPLNIKGDESQQYFEDRQSLLRNWDELKEITDLRNKVVHNLNYNIDYDVDRIHEFIDTVGNFLTRFSFFTFIVEGVKNPDRTVTITHQLELEFGNKFDVYSEIIKKQMKNFKFKKFY